MKNARKITAVLSMGLALSAVTGMNTFAADKAFQLDVANWTDQDWNSIAMTNDDTVQTGVIIRAEASSDSEAVGYLYRGAAVNIVSRDDSWTEIRSGAVTGYVMNDYLVSGDAAKGLAEYYGKEGVVANWDDVNVYSDKEAGTVTKTVKDDTTFPLVSDEGHWLLVQQGADSAGYVSEEDASRMLLVDTAVPADGEDMVSSYAGNLGGTTASVSGAGQAEVSSDQTYDDQSVAADAGAADTSTYTDTSDNSAYTDTTDASAYTDTSDASAYTDTGADAAASSETSAQLTTQQVSSNADVQALYDAYVAAQNAAMNCTTAEDANAKAQAAIDAYNAYIAAANGAGTAAQASSGTLGASGETAPAGTSAYTDTSAQTQSQTAQTEAQQTETQQTETPQTEAQTSAPQTEAQTQAQTSGSTGSYADYSDLDLLAAIIWCEAGNQPYDGMVAVGEVVMNRVASPSFPNTIAEVLEQPGQFSPYASGRLQSALAAGINSTCYQAAQDALNGAQPVPGALYFNTHSGTTKLGDHYFS